MSCNERNQLVTVAVIIQATFSLVGIIFGIVDSFSLIRDILGLIPIMNVMVDLHSAVRIIFSHWWERLSFFGILVLIVGMIWFFGTFLLWQRRKMGAFIVCASFTAAFIINLYVGLHPFLHLIAGIIAGIIVIPPVLLSWNNLK